MSINDGGPAYPARVSVNRDTNQLQEHQFGNDDFCTLGMSLRDAMAMSVRLPDDYSAKWGEALIGEQAPNSVEPVSVHIDWWMRVEAVYRYRMADAMINVREEG